MNIRRLIHIFIAFTCLAMLSACYNYDQEGIEEVNAGNYYINLAISVSNGNEHSTRADEPAGGEDGNGREAGFERENTITGITLILYKDAAGINTTANPTLDLVRYFPVTLETGGRETQGSDQSPHKEEARYTTGNQPLGKHLLDLSGQYHAIVIANAPELATSLKEGVSKLSNIRDVTTKYIYVGNPTLSADNCTNFVMSSEQDDIIDFGSVEPKNLDGVTPHEKGKDMLFNLTTQPILIERLAARIDFWAANSTGYDATTYSKKGYVYNVTGSTTDKFVVTGIVPFNLTNSHINYGKEFLLKRLKDDLSATTVKYLDPEIALTSYVFDPNTHNKTNAVMPELDSPLSGLYPMIPEMGPKNIENADDNPHFHSIEAMQASASKSTIGGQENVVVCYPMENCLLPESRLYYHATGIAIVGYYYLNGTGSGKRLVYLGYLRHQGEAETYDIQPYTTPLPNDATATMGTTKAMNFGIVRNNIYRVSINSIDKMSTMELSIKVKKWDPYIHDFIYM